jgi:hypothetical protein
MSVKLLGGFKMFAVNQRKPISAVLLSFFLSLLTSPLFGKPVTVDEVRNIIHILYVEASTF